jgi:hypothetical protein
MWIIITVIDELTYEDKNNIETLYFLIKNLAGLNSCLKEHT